MKVWLLCAGRAHIGTCRYYSLVYYLVLGNLLSQYCYALYGHYVHVQY